VADVLFMFLAEGVAGDAASKRAGARHALLIFVAASDMGAAQVLAIERAENQGWRFVELKRGKEVSDDLADISDTTLRQAAQSAYDVGYGIVIYSDEIAPHS
jgi:hypothetical protein